MSNANRRSDNLSEGAHEPTSLPEGFIGLYMQLAGKGWVQSADDNATTKEMKKTLEVQRMILEKPYTGTLAFEKIQILLMFKNGKVVCQMNTVPLMPHFYRQSTKDIGSLHLLLQEIDDYSELLMPSKSVEAIRRTTRIDMEKTQRLIRGTDGILRPARDDE